MTKFIDDYLPIIFMLMAIILFFGLFYGAYRAGMDDNARKTECMMLGGVYIDEFCVKPGSFIELRGGK